MRVAPQQPFPFLAFPLRPLRCMPVIFDFELAELAACQRGIKALRYKLSMGAFPANQR